MPFKNRIRLPFYITKAQFPSEQNVFRRADGSTKTLSVIVNKTYEGETAHLPEHIHERLKIALSHDEVNIEGQRYFGGVSMDGDFDIAWEDFLDYPLGKASFKVRVTPFDYSNDNCQTCEQASQLNLQDDTVTGLYESLEEGQEYEFNVFENDTICCSPITAEIVTINSLYVESATINEQSGIVTLTIKASVPSAILANLVTYRVTCPDGSYDEADVLANISGSEEPSCEVPGTITIEDVSATSAIISWGQPSTGMPAGGYYYEIYTAADPINPVQTGILFNDTNVFTDLVADTDYIIYIQSVCDDENRSTFVSSPFTTAEQEGGCGKYEVHFDDGTGIRGTWTTVTYLDCAGEERSTPVFNMTFKIVCALENAPGDPVDIVGATSIEYIEPC